MTRLLPIVLALACLASLALSIDPAFLNWLLLRAWVFTLAIAPGAALVFLAVVYGLGANYKFLKGISSPPDGEMCSRFGIIERLVLSFAGGIGTLSWLTAVFGFVDIIGSSKLLLVVGMMIAVIQWRKEKRRWCATPNMARSARGESGDMSQQSEGLGASGKRLGGFGDGPVYFGSRVAWIIFAFAAVLVALTALTPPLIFDVTEYHLGAWTNYLRGGEARFVPMPYNFYARFPFPVEFIYFTGLGLTPGIDTAPKLFNAACVFACAVLAWCLARRLGGGRTASAVATLLALTHPVMLDVSVDALIDAPVALLVAGSFYAGFVALGLFGPGDSTGETHGFAAALDGTDKTDQTDLSKLNNPSDMLGSSDPSGPFNTPSLRTLSASFTPHFTFVTIFLFGAALAAKYTVAQLYLLPWALLIFAPLVWQQIRNKPGRRALLWGCIAAAVPCMFWFGKNVIWYGNPLEPFFEHIFRPGDTAAIAREKFYIDSHFPQSPLTSQYWQTLLPRLHEFGWVLLIVCAGWIFARGRRRALLRFAAIALLAFLLWNTVRDSQNRFLLPLFVMLAAFAAVGAEAIPYKFARRAIFGALILFATASSVKHGLRVHKSDVMSYVLNFAPSSRTTDFSDTPEPSPREEFIETNLGDFGRMVNHVNRTLPSDARLLLIYEARPYLFRPDTEYNVVWDDSWLLDVIRPAKNVDEAVALLHQRGITHVLINRQELLRYIQQYARREQLLRLGVGPDEDPRTAWLATAHPEDLYPPFYRDPDWDRLRPIVQELLAQFDAKAVERRGASQPAQGTAVQAKPLDIILTPMSAM